LQDYILFSEIRGSPNSADEDSSLLGHDVM